VIVALLGLSVVIITGCRNWLEPCATGLEVQPALDSAAVDSSRPFQAVLVGGCGFAPFGPTSAVWRSSDTTIARLAGTDSNGRAVVTGIRRGRVHIFATADDRTGSASFVVK
jgi:hypothetical protein